MALSGHFASTKRTVHSYSQGVIFLHTWNMRYLLIEGKKDGTSQDRTSCSEDKPDVHVLPTLGWRRVAQGNGSF
jgi:hypothetical protein